MKQKASVEVVAEGNSTTIIGTGEMDLAIVREFRSAVHQAMPTDLTIDLREAHFIDSAILGVMAEAGTGIRKRGDRMRVIVRQNSHPQYVLGTVGFSAIMDVIAEPPAAEKAAQSS